MRQILVVVITLLLTGCGGGKTSGSATTVSGIAATGSAVSGTISLKDAAGRELSVTTTDGTYAFDVSTLTPPFMLKAAWGANTMYSFATSAGTANITPLTQMVVAAAASATNLDAMYLSPTPASFGAIATNLPAAKTNLLESLKPILTGASAGMDPISGRFAANGTGMDGLLDKITVTLVSGTISVADKTSGSTLFTAPATPTLANAVSAMGWSNDQAAIANDPDLKESETGDALVVWWQYAGQGNGASVIQARWLNSEVSATSISTATGFAGAPKVAVDARGNAAAVWMQSTGQITDIWVNRYAAGAGWGTPVKLTSAQSAASGPSGIPSIAMDASGNAVIIWNQSYAAIPSHFDIYTSRYSAERDGWSAPEMLSNGTNSAGGYQVVANAAGKVAVIYSQYQRTDGIAGNGDASDIWVATGTTGAGFTTHTKISSSANLFYGQASLAIDTAGDLVAAWIQNNDSGYFDVWTSRQSAAAPWEAPETVANSVTGECYFPEVAIDAGGNALVTWEQQLDTQGQGRQYLAASRRPAGGPWGLPVEVSDGTGDTYDQHLVVDGSGNATVVWYQVESAAVTLKSVRYRQSSGWGTPQLITTMGAAYDGYTVFPVPRISINSAGNSSIIWGTSSM